jgi:hypothetical protein
MAYDKCQKQQRMQLDSMGGHSTINKGGRQGVGCGGMDNDDFGDDDG